MFLNLQKSQKIIQANEASDFKKIYDAAMILLFKIAYRIVNNREVAEDLAHDSLIKMHEKKMTFPSIDEAKYWLIRVVKNASLNYARRKGREYKAYEKAFREDTRKIDSGEISLLKNESKKYVHQALDKLPNNLRVVLILKEYTELNYKEIGRILGISEGNVKVRIFRAREHLLKFIGEEDVYMS
ncbi:MAG: RNA polymerase sigma factor [Treponemataceae bacterium]